MTIKFNWIFAGGFVLLTIGLAQKIGFLLTGLLVMIFGMMIELLGN